MTLSTALSIANAGLSVTSAELDVVATNISNADTVGYTRKTIDRAEAVYDGRLTGVVNTSTQRAIDELAQAQYWNETSATQYSATLNDYLAQVDEIFGQPGTNSTLDTLVNDFAEALQALATNPDDATARLEVLNDASVLATRLNSSADSVQALRQDAEYAIEAATDTLNDTLQQIEKLDQEIRVFSLSGDEPSGLLDQRDSLITELSQLVDIKVQHTDNNGVRISTSSGVMLYDLEASEFAFSSYGNVSAETSWSTNASERELSSIYLTGSGGSMIDVTASNGFVGGSIGALFELRDETLVEAQMQLDELAAGLADAFSEYMVPGTAATAGAQEGFELDLGAVQPGDEFTLTYEDVSTGETQTVSFIRVDSTAALPLSDDATARTDDSVVGIDFSSGMADVVTQIQASLGGNFTVSNPSGNMLSILDDGATNLVNIGSFNATVTATGLTDTAEALPMFVDSGTGGGVYTGSFENGSQEAGFASRISVNANLEADPGLLVQYDSTVGSGDQTRPTALYNALTQDRFTFAHRVGGETVEMSVDDFANYIISYQAEQAATAKTRYQGQEIVMNNVQSRLEDSSKVDVDTELARLLELQTAYSANARVMTAVREMLDALMRI